jgi:threonine/homoserine/homoserine lactone efflux protein
MDVSWPVFLAVVLAAYVVPGPDFAVILRSSTRSVRAGFAAAAGAQLGLCVHMLLAVVGVSAVLAAHPGALVVVRLLGGLYLLYLGGRLVLGSLRRRPTGPSPADTGASFAQALLTNLTNPKAVLFFASVLPQFVGGGGLPVAAQVLLLGAVDVVAGFVPWTVVVLLGSGLARWLATDVVRRWWDRVTGVVLAALGGALVAEGR